MSIGTTFVTPQQALIHALFRKHRSMSVVARLLDLSQIRVREALVQHERNVLRDAGIKPPPLKEMLKGDVTTRHGVPRSESGGRPAKHPATELVPATRSNDGPARSVESPDNGVVRFVVTTIDSTGDAHSGFMENLAVYAAAIGAELLVYPLFGRKPAKGSRWDIAAITLDPLIVESALEVTTDIMPPLSAARPLDGLRHRSSVTWTIVPHPAIQFETLPRIRADGLRLQLTTGSATVLRSDRSSSSRELGAVVVEVAHGGRVHCRHILSRQDGDGSFQDLDVEVAGGTVRRGVRAEAITFGDIHAANMDANVAAATWGIGLEHGENLVDRLRPRTMVFHDLCDFDARNPFDARDHHRRFAQSVLGGGDVRDELSGTVSFLEHSRRSWSESVVVASNHDDRLIGWLREADFRQDPTNAVFFLERSLALHRRIAAGDPNSGFFEQTLREISRDGLTGVRFLKIGEGLKIAGIEASIHGHLGADGRPGNVRFFEQLGIRATLGHTHRPLSRAGIYCAGVCNGELAYAAGSITGWAIGHVVTYRNGARQHLIFDGRAFYA